MEVSPLPGPHRVAAAERGLTDALQRGVGPVGLGGAVAEDALDEAGGTGFAFVARVAGVAQAGVEQCVVAHIDVRVGYVLGVAASRWRCGGDKRKKRDGDRNREVGHPPDLARCAERHPAGSNPAKGWEWAIGAAPGLGEPHPACKKTPVRWLCLCTGAGEGESCVSGIFVVTCSGSFGHRSLFAEFCLPASDYPSPAAPAASCHQLLPFGCTCSPLFSLLILQLDMKNSRRCVSPPATSRGFFPTGGYSQRPRRQLKIEHHVAGQWGSDKL